MEQQALPRRRATPAPAPAAAAAHGGPLDAAAHSRQPSPNTELGTQTEMLSQTDAAELHVARMLSMWAVLAHTAGQVPPLLAWADLPAGERAQRLASILLMLAFHLLLNGAPRFYLRYSTQLQTALRLLYYAFPLLRKPRGIQAVLNGEPTPGLAGALLDTLRVAWGSRLMAVLMTSLITPLHLLPLVPHLLLQLYAVLMVRNNASLCAAPLLAHPLTQRRLRRLYHVMDMLLLVLPTGALLLPGGGASMLNRTGSSDDSSSGIQHSSAASAQCEGALNFLAAILGLLLPLVFLRKTEHAASLARIQTRRTRAPSCGMLGLLVLAWHRVEAGIEEALRQLVGRSWLAVEPPPPNLWLASEGERAVAWLLLLAATWVWCAAPAAATAT